MLPFLVQFEKAVVDRLTMASKLPIARIGIRWKGSTASPTTSTVRRINIIGTKNPDDYFTIFLPRKPTRRANVRQGVCLCMHVCGCCVFLCCGLSLFVIVHVVNITILWCYLGTTYMV